MHEPNARFRCHSNCFGNWREKRVFGRGAVDDADELKRFVVITKCIHKPVVIPCCYFALASRQKTIKSSFSILSFGFYHFGNKYADSWKSTNINSWKMFSHFSHLHRKKRKIHCEFWLPSMNCDIFFKTSNF